MKIGIDISQTAYEGTGVSEYMISLLQNLTTVDSKNEYILFFSSLREKTPQKIRALTINKNVTIKEYKIPLRVLDIVWNRLHIIPIELFVGSVDIFISSDWVFPPTFSAKKVTILYDLIIYKYPRETDQQIIDTQKRRLEWVKKECDRVICISEATKKDAINILNLKDSVLQVIYPGI